MANHKTGSQRRNDAMNKIFDKARELNRAKTIENIADSEFDVFFAWLPERVKLCVRSGMVDWKITLPEWFEKYKEEKYIM
jgi:hypothetical protein